MVNRVTTATVVLFLLAFALAGAVTPALAADTSCSATPGSGPAGTDFSLTVSGFTPNTHLWTYAVEPDGTAFSDPEFNAFGGTVKTNEAGEATISFPTRFVVYGYPVARALGSWTVVAQELGLAGAIVHEAHCTVTITSGGEQALGGATLDVNPYLVTVGNNALVTGAGFGANETVNLWVSPPPNCSGFAFTLPEAMHQKVGSSAYMQANVKANEDGEISYTLPTYSIYSCQGKWAISAYAPGSGAGASAEFVIEGRAVPGGATLTVDKWYGYTRGDTFVFSGTGYTPWGIASCWTTRPEGTVRPIGDFKVNGDGTLALNLTTGFDFEGDFDGDTIIERMHYSEGSIGVYSMTCRDNATGATGETTFTLNGLVSDP